MVDPDFDPPAGVAQTLAPGLLRVLAPNPSPMTWRGTNSYLVGQRSLAVIDPGPASPSHLKALLGAIDNRPVSAILVSHSHVDHSALAGDLARATGAPVLAFGDSGTGRSPVMTQLAKGGFLGGGEGVDADFHPDRTLADGAVISGDDWRIIAHWTPGHMGNHMCFQWNDALFTGDHVMGWATSLVSPPDGDLTRFMASCRRLLLRPDRVYYPGHGAPIDDPAARVSALIAHRLMREGQILHSLECGPATAGEITARLYTEVADALLPAAQRNVLAHLIDLVQRDRVQSTAPLSASARFALS